MATQTLRYADIVSFTCLKAFALEHRGESKDAHDLIYCLENHLDGLGAVAFRFREALGSKHVDAITQTLAIIESRFCGTGEGEGYLEDGPVKAAN